MRGRRRGPPGGLGWVRWLVGEVVRQSIFVSEFPPSVILSDATFPQGGTAFLMASAAQLLKGCLCRQWFMVMKLCAHIPMPPPLGGRWAREGSVGGELACRVVWPFGFGAVFLNGNFGGGCVGCGAVLV